MSKTWHRADWNPVDGWGGAARIQRTGWEHATKVTNAHEVVRKWMQQSMTESYIVHDEQDLIIYLGFYHSGNKDGIPYMTIWKYME